MTSRKVIRVEPDKIVTEQDGDSELYNFGPDEWVWS